MVCGDLSKTASLAMSQIFASGEFENVLEEIDELQLKYDKLPRPAEELIAYSNLCVQLLIKCDLSTIFFDKVRTYDFMSRNGTTHNHFCTIGDTSFIFHRIIEMKNNFIVLIMALIVFLVVRIQTTSKPKFPPDRTFQMCGKHLSALLALVCESKYNTPIPTRSRYLRSISTDSDTDVEDESTTTAVETTIEPKGIVKMILAREEAQSLLAFRRRRRRGAYDECCKKACFYKELTAYCAGS
ncbi:hypothetical protein Trydic_g455 [Trypoxylus dichotomus]